MKEGIFNAFFATLAYFYCLELSAIAMPDTVAILGRC